MRIETTTFVKHPSINVVEGMLRLHHGTNSESAHSIITYGVDDGRASVCGGEGKFWCATELAAAVFFAKSTLCCSPKIITFDLSVDVIEACLSNDPPLVLVSQCDYYMFQPGSFSILNSSMQNVRVVNASAVFTQE